MKPVVDELRTAYKDQIQFDVLNRDSKEAGYYTEIFGLQGHPSFLILDAEGNETWRAFGIVEQQTIEEAFKKVL